MKKIFLALLFAVLSCNASGQDRLSLFIGSANRYASVELSDYRKRLSVEYNVGSNELDNYYRRCGNDWGNVGLALEIARTSGRKMSSVCDYYKRYHKQGWNRILLEIGIMPGSSCYDPFYERVHHHHDLWDRHYNSYCDRHGKVHSKNHRHKHHSKHDNGKHKGHYKHHDKRHK